MISIFTAFFDANAFYGALPAIQSAVLLVCGLFDFWRRRRARSPIRTVIVFAPMIHIANDPHRPQPRPGEGGDDQPGR